MVRTDGRAGGRCTVTWLPNFLGWVDLLTHGVPQARFARQSSAKKAKPIYKHTNKPAYQRATTVLFFLQLFLLVNLACFVLNFFFRWSDAVWWTADQLALLYSVFICSSFTSFGVTAYKSQRFFGLFIVLSIIASVFNHCSCLRVHSSLVISWCTFHNPEGFAWREAAGLLIYGELRKITSWSMWKERKILH